MVGDGTRIKTVSGALFRGEQHLLTRNCVHWKLTLDDAIDRERLQEALDAALEICPYMGLSVGRDDEGMWYVPNPAPVRLLREAPERLGTGEVDGHLFCLVCGERDVEAIVYHGLTDGAGLGWFMDALLNAYYGTTNVSYQGVGTTDYACDPMASELELPEGYVAEPVMPEERFAFPEGTSERDGERHLMSFSRGELKAFQAEHDCSTTAALLTLLAVAIERVHPENQDPICMRCPINSRGVLGIPHAFMNASMPQAVVAIDPRQARDGDVDEIAGCCLEQMAPQITRDHVAFFTNQVSAALRRERSEQMRVAMDAFQAPVVFSSLGTLTGGAAGMHVVASEAGANGYAPIMANLSIVADTCHLVLNQSFEGTDYVDALEAVMAEHGIHPNRPCSTGDAALQEGKNASKDVVVPAADEPPEDMPRFMDRLARIVRAYGNRTALVSDMRTVTYAQLDEESGKVYSYLKRHGIGTESIVAVVTPRDASFFSCVGGVLRAGAAFVPLEDTYPAERIAYITKDSGCVLVLNQQLYEKIMAEEDYLAGYERTDVHDACYVVYTSGSTGNPKGVLHEYGSLDMQALQTPEKGDLPVSIRGAIESFYFIAVIFFGIRNFLSAATVHIIDREIVRNFRAFSEYIDEHRIESLFMPSSYARAYKNPSPSLKTIIVGSEPANNLYYQGGVPAVRNVYGMSESGSLILETVFDHAYEVSPVGVPPVPGIDLHLEDEEGRRVEGAGSGEICFRNTFFRGYINLPEKTAEVVRDGVFHTGDLARRDERGLYYIRGRKDDMFKVNGNRIEPAEIERRVSEVTGLGQVVAKGFQEGSRAFVCAYFLRGEAEGLGIWDGQRLTCDLGPIRRLLPDYMIPAHYVALDEFPHNANGKLAKIELEAPELEAPGRGYVAPASERERLFCDLMAEVLELDRVGATDDFYELGGDSMGVVMFVSACADVGYDISLATLYKNRTPRALAATCAHDAPSQGDRHAVAREALERPQPVLANQLTNVRQLDEDPQSIMFNLPQLLELKQGTDLERLRAALDKVFAAHPALLSTFRKMDDSYCLAYDESLFEPTRIVRLSDEEFVRMRKKLVVPFEGFGKVLQRRAIYQSDSAAYLFWDLHHSVADGTSMVLLRDQVYACYENPDYQIPEDDYFSYLEQAAQEQTDTSNHAFAEARDHYAAYGDAGEDAGTHGLVPDLEGPSAAPATIVGPREHTRTSDGGSALFLAATAIAAARLNNRETALVYTAYHGRNTQAQRQSVGMYATSIPVHLDLVRCATVGQIMGDVRAQLDFGMAHSTYPYQWLNPAPQHSTVMFNYQRDTMDLGSLAAIVSKRINMELSQNSMVITGLIDQRGADYLTWYCGYNSGYYSAERMEAFHEEFDKAVAWLREGTDA